MKTYTFNAVIGEDAEGNALYREFVIEAENFRQARSKLSELLKQLQ